MMRKGFGPSAARRLLAARVDSRRGRIAARRVERDTRRIDPGHAGVSVGLCRRTRRLGAASRRRRRCRDSRATRRSRARAPAASRATSPIARRCTRGRRRSAAPTATAAIRGDRAAGRRSARAAPSATSSARRTSQPTLDIWKTSANPIRSAAQVLRRVARVHPLRQPRRPPRRRSDLRAVPRQEVHQRRTSMMTHGACSGAPRSTTTAPSRSRRRASARATRLTARRSGCQPIPPPTPRRDRALRACCRSSTRCRASRSPSPATSCASSSAAAASRPRSASPIRTRSPAGPTTSFSDRGLGTANRTDPVFIGLQKTRLLDPTLNFLGTNDHPGDYRSSGCTACHVIYANDRVAGALRRRTRSSATRARTQTADPTIPKDEPGHPIEHTLHATRFPTSQCIVCHIHPGTNVMNTLPRLHVVGRGDRRRADVSGQSSRSIRRRGARRVAGRATRKAAALTRHCGPTRRSCRRRARRAQPAAQAHAVRRLPRPRLGLPRRLQARPQGQPARHAATSERPKRRRCVSSEPTRHSRRGNAGAAADGVPVHLMDIHLEKGMHCVDCHFEQDNHGNGKLYGETRNAVEIDCVDCHGTVDAARDAEDHRPRRRDPDRAARDLAALRTPFGERALRAGAGDTARSSTRWSSQGPAVGGRRRSLDTITPGNPHYNEKVAPAPRRSQTDGTDVGRAPRAATALAHAERAA